MTADSPLRGPSTASINGTPETSGKTTLHFPDNSVTLEWHGGNRASATFAGMNPQDVTVTTAEGVTRFTFKGKPYF